MSHIENTVSPSASMPKGYGFLEKGNPFMTALCRRKTHAASKDLYVVVQNKKTLGLRAPVWIIGEVLKEERDSRVRRNAAVQKRDDATKDEFATAVRKQFPRIPDADLTQVLKRSLKKRSGRVGRTGLISEDKKSWLAVMAHIRHCHTRYDSLLRARTDRKKARTEVKSEVLRVQQLWGGGGPPKGRLSSTRPKANSRRAEQVRAIDQRPPRVSEDKITKTIKKDMAPQAEQRERKKKKKSRKQRQRERKEREAEQGPTEARQRPDNSAEATTTSLKRKRNEAFGKREATRTSTRLSSAQAALEMLDVFEDDDEAPRSSSDEADEDELELDMFSDDFIEEDEEDSEDSYSDWSSE